MTLAARILAAMDHATPQQPIYTGEITRRLADAGCVLLINELLDALADMTTQRLVGTARITRSGVTQDVYWPTGLKTPVLTGIQPKEPLSMPNQDIPSESLAKKLIKAIVAHGPLLAKELAEHSGVPENNIGGNLAHAIKTGSITTRKQYVAERGRVMTHYMTATQAQEWDEREAATEDPEAPPAANPAPPAAGCHVMSHPDAETLRDLNAEIHALRNDVAAHKLILGDLQRLLGVNRIEDLHTAIERLQAEPQGEGRPALLLVDSSELTEVEPLPAEMNLREMRQEALNAIDQGHAARAFVVRILGEARRLAEWKEAA